MPTTEQLLSIFPHAIEADEWAPAIAAAWERFGYVTPNARAGYLGIIGNETGGLREVHRENMRYSPARAAQVFTKARRNPNDCADRCARGQEAFANWIYAGIIGNGDEASGDGWAFRGGGIIQLTGRANYRACAEALGVDIVTYPDLLTADPRVSAASAAWFMSDYARIMPMLESDSEEDFLAGARKVGLPADANTTANRLAHRRKALEVLGA